MRDSGCTGTVTEASDQPGWVAPRVTTREPDSTFTVTRGPSAAVRLRRSAVVPRGSVSPPWQADAGLAVLTSVCSVATPPRATVSGACASVSTNASAISANPTASATLILISGAAAR